MKQRQQQQQQMKETTTAATASGETPRTRSRRAASQGSDNSPVDVETTLKDGETATPDISNPNGATVKSQDVPDASFKKQIQIILSTF